MKSGCEGFFLDRKGQATVAHKIVGELVCPLSFLTLMARRLMATEAMRFDCSETNLTCDFACKFYLMKRSVMKRSVILVVLIGLFLSLLSLPVLAQNQDSQGTAIHGCTVISKPGSYVLAKNITARRSDLKTVGDSWPSCILVMAPNVSLDLQGYTITGDSTLASTYGMAGISSPSRFETTWVRNGAVSQFFWGFYLGGMCSLIEHVRVSYTDTGITLSNGGQKVKDVSVFSSSRGIVFGGGPDGGWGDSVENSTVLSNSSDGIDMSGCLHGSRIVGNTVIQNGGRGIVASCPSLILQNLSSGNGQDNISIVGSGCIQSDNNPAP